MFQGNIIGVVAKSLRQKDKDTGVTGAEVFLRGASQNSTVKTNPLSYGFRNRGSHRHYNIDVLFEGNAMIESPSK